MTFKKGDIVKIINIHKGQFPREPFTITDVCSMEFYVKKSFNGLVILEVGAETQDGPFWGEPIFYQHQVKLIQSNE